MSRVAVLAGFHPYVHEIGPRLAGEDVLLVPAGDELASLAETEVVIGGNDPDRLRAVLAAAPGLRWYHTLAAGVERLVVPELTLRMRDGLVLTNNSGAYDLAIAEHVIATTFVAAKRLHRSFATQGRHEWHEDPRSADVRGATMVILGQGSIGGELASIAGALGMNVIGIRRTPGPGVLGPGDLGDAASQADYLVVCAPLTSETRGMVGREILARMKPSAWLINISRGAVVDEASLFEALSQRRIAGAAIDAWWTEPLPKDSPWWDLPNVIVTPHTSFSSPSVRERSLALIVENHRRFRAGEPLLNRVDPVRGY